MGVKGLEENHINHINNCRKFYKEYCISNNLNGIEDNICHKKTDIVNSESKSI